MRVAGAEEAEDVFVEEVEVPEAVDVAEGGDVADGVALIGIAKSGENVPGCGDGEEKQEAGDGLQLAPATPLAAEQQQGNDGGDEKYRGDQALGKRGQRERGPGE